MRSDVFSFGVVLYELLAGRRAFGAESDWSAIKVLVHDQPRLLPFDHCTTMSRYAFN